MKAYLSGAGDAVIDLGAGNGQLIAPVQVDGGKWFYHWDRNKNQDSSDDLIPRYELNSIFKYSSEGIEGTGTTDTYRYASVNGVLLALPMLGVSNQVLADWFATKSQQEKVDPEWAHMVPPATAIGSLNPGVGDVTLNPAYNGLLAIWDAFNGKAETALAGDGDSKGSINGAPQGWGTGWAEYASASKDLTSLDRHYTLPLGGGWLESQWDGGDKEGYRNSFYVALEAFKPIIVVDTLAPVVSAVTVVSDAAITKDAISFTVSFSEALTGEVGTGNFTATNGTVASVTPIQSSKAYTVVVTPTPGLASGDVTISLVGAGLSDLAGNALADASLSSLASQAVDTLAPVATFTAVKNSLGASLSAGLTNSTSLQLSGSNEAGASVSIYNGSELLGQATVAGTGWTYSISTTHNGTYDLRVQETDAAGNVGAMKAYFAGAGDAVIDLGAGNGQLIAPVQVDGGKWFYHWDVSGDGTAFDKDANENSADHVLGWKLHDIFNKDVNGVQGPGTSETYRYATLNGIHLALPTIGLKDDVVATFNIDGSVATLVGTSYADTGISGIAYTEQAGSAIGSLNPSEGDNTINPLYDDLLAIWDAYNGNAINQAWRYNQFGTGWGDKPNISGMPTGWSSQGSPSYASASHNYVLGWNAFQRFYDLDLSSGTITGNAEGERGSEYNKFMVALQVLGRPVIVVDTKAPASPTIVLGPGVEEGTPLEVPSPPGPAG
jgi:hypothetical protein